MKKLIVAIVLTGLLTNLAAQTKIVIKGIVKGDTKGYNKIYYFGDNVKEDSVVMKDGAFTISIPWEPGVVPFLYSEYDSRTMQGPPAFQLVPDGSGVIYLKVADITKGMFSGTVSGNRTAVAFHKFETGNRKLNEEIKAALEKRFPQSGKNDTNRIKALVQLKREKVLPYVTRFVEANASSYIGAYVLSRYQNMLTTADLERLYYKLSPAQQASVPGKPVGDHLNGLKLAAIGNEVIDFTLPTPEGDSISFSSLKGKYLLIDFWSSWCGPCKASFPHMKAVYKKYGGEKFEILGISIDEVRSAWLKELNNQQLPWPQVLDTKKVYISGFGVTGVPTAFLVGPDGKILMKEIGFDKNGNGQIEKKLKELFEQ
ncbi:MAG: TlpA family protein disulfide reductase [Pseudobacter sp.]|uniref:TlpA family protein disulfide reductase n=1 Tax=Pseudobacter sp. TaxID=2045420 RepID=UPI003F81617A